MKKNTPEYTYTASYYLVNNQMFRNLLVIKEKNYSSRNRYYDAIAVMLNPGSSIPIDETLVKEETFASLSTNLIPCEPDPTQRQIVKLMGLNSWKNVAILNLFDICEEQSLVVINRYAHAQEQMHETVFSDLRRQELKSVFKKLKPDGTIIVAWGVNKKLQHYKTSAMDSLLKIEGNRQIVGYTNPNGFYYHPWPQGSRNQHIRKNWVPIVNQQIKPTKS